MPYVVDLKKIKHRHKQETFNKIKKAFKDGLILFDLRWEEFDFAHDTIMSRGLNWLPPAITPKWLWPIENKTWIYIYA